MTVLITGATGLIGKEIVKQCHVQDMKVHYLTTSKEKISKNANYKGFYWNTDKNSIDKECFQNVEAIINLAGSSISKRWTPSYKKEILESRLNALQTLKEALASINHTVTHLISASAVGIYPDSLINYYEEDFSETSGSFLGEVAQKWEMKADEFSDLGIKVSKVRIGLVLSDLGGAVQEMVKPMKFGAGAAFGKGTQWQSWIHLKDLAKIFVFLLQNQLQGTYNGVAPNPVTNTDLTKAIAKELQKPLILPNIPKFMMKMILGEMHILLFESQRVSSKKIEENGYHFEFNHLKPALEAILKTS